MLKILVGVASACVIAVTSVSGITYFIDARHAAQLKSLYLADMADCKEWGYDFSDETMESCIHNHLAISMARNSLADRQAEFRDANREAFNQSAM